MLISFEHPWWTTLALSLATVAAWVAAVLWSELGWRNPVRAALLIASGLGAVTNYYIVKAIDGGYVSFFGSDLVQELALLLTVVNVFIFLWRLHCLYRLFRPKPEEAT